MEDFMHSSSSQAGAEQKYTKLSNGINKESEDRIKMRILMYRLEKKTDKYLSILKNQYLSDTENT